jgi:hypothetical protein
VDALVAPQNDAHVSLVDASWHEPEQPLGKLRHLYIIRFGLDMWRELLYNGHQKKP